MCKYERYQLIIINARDFNDNTNVRDDRISTNRSYHGDNNKVWNICYTDTDDDNDNTGHENLYTVMMKMVK